MGRALVDEILAMGGVQALLVIVLLNFLCVTGCDEFGYKIQNLGSLPQWPSRRMPLWTWQDCIQSLTEILLEENQQWCGQLGKTYLCVNFVYKVRWCARQVQTEFSVGVVLNRNCVIPMYTGQTMWNLPKEQEEIWQTFSHAASDTSVWYMEESWHWSNWAATKLVIATALHIAAGNNIEEVSFDQTRMRSHLVQCFEMKVLSPFPQTKKQVKRSMLANILIPVYCHCGRPDSLDEMIQCDACDEWFHFQCAHIKRAPDSDWFCSTCTK